MPVLEQMPIADAVRLWRLHASEVQRVKSDLIYDFHIAVHALIKVHPLPCNKSNLVFPPLIIALNNPL